MAELAGHSSYQTAEAAARRSKRQMEEQNGYVVNKRDMT